jgi:hypothetical protein
MLLGDCKHETPGDFGGRFSVIGLTGEACVQSRTVRTIVSEKAPVLSPDLIQTTISAVSAASIPAMRETATIGRTEITACP